MNENKTLLEHLAEWQKSRMHRTHPSQQNWSRWLPTPGNVIFTLLVIGALIVTQGVWAKPLQNVLNAPSPSATTINYQGRLADNGGTPLDGSYGMSFALYDAATDGSLIWGPESHTAVPVSDGLFSVGLGSQTSGGIPTTTWNGDRYLEITVGGETLEPRELIRSVPVAGMALTVPDGAITSEMIGVGAVHSSHAQLANGRVSASDTISLTNSYQDIPGTTFTVSPETAQKYLVYVTADLYAYNAVAVASLVVDGAGGGSQVIFQDSNGESRGTVTQTYLIDLEPGIHTINLKAKLLTGASATIYAGHTTIVYFAISQ